MLDFLFTRRSARAVQLAFRRTERNQPMQRYLASFGLDVETDGEGVSLTVTTNGHRRGTEVVAVAKGESLWVTGDGKSNIIELVDSQINTDPRRGTNEDAPLNALAPEKGAEIILELQRQGMTAYSIPQATPKRPCECS